MSDEEDYEFDYSDDDEQMEDANGDLHVQIENQYYNAKQFMEEFGSDHERTLQALEEVLQLQQEESDWGFKALKRIVKLHFDKKEYDDAISRYEELLGYTKSSVTRNVGEKGINSILDHVSTSKVLFLANIAQHNKSSH